MSANITEMPKREVLSLLKLFNDNGIEVYIDGGWGIDALLGKQTRQHDDLDIAMPHRFVQKLKEILSTRGYAIVEKADSRDCNFVLGDELGHEIDVHTYTFDEHGNNIFGIDYKSEHLTGEGLIGGHVVKCIPPKYMVEFHTGYVVDENDYHDVKLICEKFGLKLPSIYDKFVRS